MPVPVFHWTELYALWFLCIMTNSSFFFYLNESLVRRRLSISYDRITGKRSLMHNIKITINLHFITHISLVNKVMKDFEVYT